MFSVATNFDPSLLPQLKDLNVYEVYGKLTKDIIGGCRPTVVLGNIDKRKLEREIKTAHALGIEFNYILNSSCLNNIEYSRHGVKEINKLLDYLSQVQADTLTVTIPYLAKYIRANFPHFKISVSTLSGVDNLKKYELWQDLGVESINLAVSANRDFELLAYLSKKAKCKTKIMVNQCCELDCIYYDYHTNINSHQSQKFLGFPLEFCSFNCKYRRTKDLSQLLKSPWVRPEDLEIYEKYGISLFKIVQRQDPTEKLVRATKAYFERKYEGNLLDIMNFVYNQNVSSWRSFSFSKYFKYALYLLKPQTVNVYKIYKLSMLLDDGYDLYIDNKKLNGFLEKFRKKPCKTLSCASCKYCKKYTDKAVRFNKNKREKLLKNYAQILSFFTSRERSLFC